MQVAQYRSLRSSGSAILLFKDRQWVLELTAKFKEQTFEANFWGRLPGSLDIWTGSPRNISKRKNMYFQKKNTGTIKPVQIYLLASTLPVARSTWSPKTGSTTGWKWLNIANELALPQTRAHNSRKERQHVSPPIWISLSLEVKNYHLYGCPRWHRRFRRTFSKGGLGASAMGWGTTDPELMLTARIISRESGEDRTRGITYHSWCPTRFQRNLNIVMLNAFLECCELVVLVC